MGGPLHPSLEGVHVDQSSLWHERFGRLDRGIGVYQQLSIEWSVRILPEGETLCYDAGFLNCEAAETITARVRRASPEESITYDIGERSRTARRYVQLGRRMPMTDLSS